VFNVIEVSEKFGIPFSESEAILMVINKVETYPYLKSSLGMLESCMNGCSSEVEVCTSHDE
jgi:hypothetical protein